MRNIDPIETLELPAEDQADLDRLHAVPDPPAPAFHTVLEVWREVLKPAAAESAKEPTPQWCNRIVGAYNEVTYGDMLEYSHRYFSKIEELLEILLVEIASDKDCLSYATAEEDALENAAHYKNLLLVWQMSILQWELDWKCTDPGAAVELAAISEVHKMFLGPQGIIAFLESINFEFTEADQQSLGDALLEQRGEQ